jgi:K+ transporter
VPEASLDVASLIVWSLLAIVTSKYVLLVMRADYKGEGGIFALLALLGGKDPPSVQRFGTGPSLPREQFPIER